MIQLSYRPSRCFLILVGLLTVMIITSFLTVGSASGQTDGATYELDLAALGYSTTTLTGPSDTMHYTFTLPPNWTPQTGTRLQLNVAYAVSGNASIGPASLEVRLNGVGLYTKSFSRPSSATSFKIEIPPETLRLAEVPYRNDLELILTVHAQCEEALLASLTVQSSSTLSFVYRERPLNLDLALYPKPLYYSQAFEAVPARMVFPPQPNASELTSAAMIAANLGVQTRNDLTLEASLGSTLATTDTQQHLVVIGSPERAALLSELNLPVPLQRRQMDLRSQMPTAVTSTHSFSYTLIVKNTSPTSQSLTVEDRLSPLVAIEACQNCNQVTPGLVRWNVGALDSGQTISTTVQARLDASLRVGESIEHTANLLDASGQVINVDTLTATVALEANEAIASSLTKGPYFFSLDNQGVPENDGIVQMIVSPWAANRAIIAVTGLDDAAVLRAAHALATQNKMPGMQGQFAIVQATRPATIELAIPAQDTTLAELGYDDIVIVGRADEAQLTFTVPHDATLGEEAYLAAHWTHGTAFNTISATLELSLNGAPIKSVELRPENADDNWIKVQLPAPRLKVDKNTLRFRVVATKWPDCLNTDALSRFWVTVYSDSSLHLPFQPTEGHRDLLDLADYPTFLTTQATLGDLALLLPGQITPNDARGMVQLISFLGSVSRGEYFAPRVVPGSQATPDQWSDQNLIVIGRPTQNPYIALVNDQLPQPFIPGQDEIRQQVDDVIYRWPRGLDLGYIQLLPVPWADDHAMLVVSGTTDEGLRWSQHALIDSGLNRRLSGNLAVLVTEIDVRTTDTRRALLAAAPRPTPTLAATPSATLTSTLTIVPSTPISALAVIPAPTHTPSVASSPSIGEEARAPSQGRPFWMFPLLGLGILVTIVAVAIFIRQSRF